MNPKIERVSRPVLALFAALGLSACASIDTVSSNPPETATRAAPITAPFSAGAEATAPTANSIGSYNVAAINVSVPESLRASEANRYYPGGDIVWREDSLGNRHQQVKAIVEAGLSKGAIRLNGSRAVVVDVVLTRFHALTEKARYTVGGVHAIEFDMMVRDSETGAIIMAPRHIDASFRAYGGKSAIAAEARGETQKVRITNHLAYVIQQELGSADGYAVKDNGVLGGINRL